MVDDSFRYCEHCLVSFQAGVSSANAKAAKSAQTIPLTKVTKYSLSTATSAMIRHLFDIHNFSLSTGRGSTTYSVADRRQQRLSFAGIGSGTSRVTSTSSLNEDLLMWL